MSEGKEATWGGLEIQRANKSSNVPGTLAFVGLRGAEPFLQYGILKYGWGSKIITTLGGTILAQNVVSNIGIKLLDNLELSPYRLALVGMAVGASLKQSIWKIFIGQEAMTPQFAGLVAIFNAVGNSINSYLFINKFTSPGAVHGESGNCPHLLVGGVLFTAGIFIELVSEIQRKRFKDDPNNKGKPHTTGLFGLARNINYFGYTLWRAGYATAAGGYIWGALLFGLALNDFRTRAVPELDAYCSQRYADMWKDYKEKTPYVLIPGLL